MNQMLEFGRKPSDRGAWFSWYEEIVERVLSRSVNLPDVDPDETQFLLAA